MHGLISIHRRAVCVLFTTFTYDGLSGVGPLLPCTIGSLTWLIVSSRSFATHHWAHTWLGQNLHHGTVSVDEVVRKARDSSATAKAAAEQVLQKKELAAAAAADKSAALLSDPGGVG